MLSALLPAGFRAWRERRHALREFKAMGNLDQQMLALDDSNPLYRARTALNLGDHAEALRCWLDACQRLPEFARTSHDSLGILLGLRRYDEAEALMLAGRKRSPRDSHYSCGYAEIATERNDYAEAAKRWAAARKAFPGAWRGYAFGAASLSKLGKLDEAEAVLERGLALLPTNINCRIEYARMAELRKDWLEAHRRWELIGKEFNHVLGVLGAARALQEMGRLDEAEACLAAGRQHHPTVHNIVMEQAHLAQLRGDEAAELRLWETVLQRFPLVQHGYYDAARRLTEMGKIAEADDVLRRAVERFPQEVRPGAEYATFAHKRGDWAEAANRWQAVRAAWPDYEDAYAGGAHALDQLGRHEEAAQLCAERARLSGSPTGGR